LRAEIDLAVVGGDAGLDDIAVVQGRTRQNRRDVLVLGRELCGRADVDGEQLSEQEIGSFFILLVVAGNERALPVARGPVAVQVEREVDRTLGAGAQRQACG